MSVPRTERSIASRALRQSWKAALAWGVAFGATVASTSITYATTYPDAASRAEVVAATAGDTGLAILLGPVSGVGTVGGYTVYKCFVFLTTMGAIWGLLLATRLLRGEEDAGRWQLVLSGGTRPARATAATLAALGTAAGIVFALTAAATVLAGRRADVAFAGGTSVLYAASVVLPAVVFMGVGAVTSQLARSRRLATGLGMAVFAVTMLARMIADSGPGTRWLLWLTPFGWSERIRPFAGSDLRPLLLAASMVAVLAAAATWLAAHRDVGSGALASRDTAALRPRGLGSPLGLVARLEAPVLAAWCAGAAGSAFAFGIIAKVASGPVPSSLGDALERFGVRGAFVKQYFGVAILFGATIVALLPASQLGAAADDETSGRLVHVLARPARRDRLLAGRLALAAAAVVVGGLLTGIGSWAGARSQGVETGLWTMTAAGLNVVPTALLVLGIGAVVLAVAPRAATRAVYGVVVASLLIDVFAALLVDVDWLGNLSLFHYMALAPAQDVDGRTVAITLAAAAASCALAMALARRRDVRLT